MNTIDNICKKINEEVPIILKCKKIDGITLECYIYNKLNVKDNINEIRNQLHILNINPMNIEINKKQPNVFALQFPELDVQYSENENNKLYESIFNWLLNNYTKNVANKKLINKEQILKNGMIFTKQAIDIYYRSYINQYKHNIKDYMNNFEYRIKLDKLFELYVDIWFDSMEDK